MTRFRLLRRLAIALPLLAVIAYGGASWYVYDQLSHVEAKCPGEKVVFDPTSFRLPEVDTEPYLMPEPDDVRFPSRGDPDITIAAWWVASDARPDAPAVIVVHGHNGCRRNATNLLVAGMLHRAGLAVMVIDLRDHGDSTVEDGRFAGGTDEHRDVLGAVDWLLARETPPADIGVMGSSLGAATATIAFGQEPRIAALWEDSGFADISEAIRDELARNNYPTFLAAGGVIAGRLIVGDDLTAYSPLEEIGRANGRPVFITHGTDDERLSVRYAEALAARVRESGGEVEPWIVPGAGHTQAITLVTDEYERRLIEFFGEALGAP